MFKFYLFVGLLINGNWLYGHEVMGYHPREQPSWSACIERRDFAQSKKPPRGITQWRWYCRKILQ